jgi:hypothetical protein
MSNIDEKLIVKLGQRISEQNGILRTIAASLQGVESHLRQIAVSSNPAPNYQRPLSEYPMFDWDSIGATDPQSGWRRRNSRRVERPDLHAPVAE